MFSFLGMVGFISAAAHATHQTGRCHSSRSTVMGQGTSHSVHCEETPRVQAEESSQQAEESIYCVPHGVISDEDAYDVVPTRGRSSPIYQNISKQSFPYSSRAGHPMEILDARAARESNAMDSSSSSNLSEAEYEELAEDRLFGLEASDTSSQDGVESDKASRDTNPLLSMTDERVQEMACSLKVALELRKQHGAGNGVVASGDSSSSRARTGEPGLPAEQISRAKGFVWTIKGDRRLRQDTDQVATPMSMSEVEEKLSNYNAHWNSTEDEAVSDGAHPDTSLFRRELPFRLDNRLREAKDTMANMKQRISGLIADKRLAFSSNPRVIAARKNWPHGVRAEAVGEFLADKKEKLANLGGRLSENLSGAVGSTRNFVDGLKKQIHTKMQLAISATAANANGGPIVNGSVDDRDRLKFLRRPLQFFRSISLTTFHPIGDPLLSN